MNITEDLAAFCERTAKEREKSINSYCSCPEITGTKYYLSSEGDDGNDGLSPEKPWKTINKINVYPLKPGDGVFFRRTDVFRGNIAAKTGVTYAAYGKGKRPELRGSPFDLAEKDLWRPFGRGVNLWELAEPIRDCGTLVFNEGEAHAYKHIPSYYCGKFVCRNSPDIEFDPEKHLADDLDFVWLFDEVLTKVPSKDESFYVPEVGKNCLGKLILRCDKGNPGEVFESIEALTFGHMFEIGSENDVTVDGLAIKYVGTHAIGAVGRCVKNLTVTNCEIGWIGGCIQHYFGTDPNFPQGRRGTVTRYGNGVEIYGGCDGYTVSDCYVYQVYDAGVTHQISTNGKEYILKNIVYKNNLIENCTYGIEYFLDKNHRVPEEDGSIMENILMENNVIRLSGFGWGSQRTDKSTPAAVKGWDHSNPAKDFSVKNNVFDRSSQRLLHMVSDKYDCRAEMSGNIYIQRRGNVLCRYGGKDSEIIEYAAENNISEIIKLVLKDLTGAGTVVD